MTHAGAVTCPCVATHSPVPVDVEIHHVHPLGLGGPDTAANEVPLCPTAHSSVHWLLHAYRRHEGTPPWEVRRRVGPYLRGLAQEGWDAYVAARDA